MIHISYGLLYLQYLLFTKNKINTRSNPGDKMADITLNQMHQLASLHADRIEEKMINLSRNNLNALGSLFDRKFKDRKRSPSELANTKSRQENTKATNSETDAKVDAAKAQDKATDSLKEMSHAQRGVGARMKEMASEMGTFSSMIVGAKQALDEMKTAMAHAGSYDPFEAIKMGMSAKELIELKAQYRQAGLAMAGGVEKFTQNVSTLQNDIYSRVGDMGQAAKIAADTMDQAQSVGVKVGIGTGNLVKSLTQNMKNMQDVTGDTLEVLSANNRSLIQSTDVRDQLMGLDQKQREQYTKNILTLQTWNRSITSSNEEAQELTKSFARMQAESPKERIKRAYKATLMAQSQGLITAEEGERRRKYATLGTAALSQNPEMAKDYQQIEQKMAEGVAKMAAGNDLQAQVFASKLGEVIEPFKQNAQAVAMAEGKTPIPGAAQQQDRLVSDDIFGKAVGTFMQGSEMFSSAVNSAVVLMAAGAAGSLLTRKGGAKVVGDKIKKKVGKKLRNTAAAGELTNTLGDIKRPTKFETQTAHELPKKKRPFDVPPDDVPSPTKPIIPPTGGAGGAASKPSPVSDAVKEKTPIAPTVDVPETTAEPKPKSRSKAESVPEPESKPEPKNRKRRSKRDLIEAAEPSSPIAPTVDVPEQSPTGPKTKPKKTRGGKGKGKSKGKGSMASKAARWAIEDGADFASKATNLGKGLVKGGLVAAAVDLTAAQAMDAAAEYATKQGIDAKLVQNTNRFMQATMEGAAMGATVASLIPVPGLSQAAGAVIGGTLGLAAEYMMTNEDKLLKERIAGIEQEKAAKQQGTTDEKVQSIADLTAQAKINNEQQKYYEEQKKSLQQLIEGETDSLSARFVAGAGMGLEGQDLVEQISRGSGLDQADLEEKLERAMVDADPNKYADTAVAKEAFDSNANLDYNVTERFLKSIEDDIARKQIELERQSAEKDAMLIAEQRKLAEEYRTTNTLSAAQLTELKRLSQALLEQTELMDKQRKQRGIPVGDQSNAGVK